MTVDIRVAGPLAVEAASFRLGPADLPGRQGRLVLAALALRDEAVDRDELAHLLWPDALPGSWRVDLSAVVSKLRAALRPLRPDGEPPIAGGRGWYRLDLPVPVRVDVIEAERALVEAERDRARTAASALDAVLDVTRRPFLPGDECLWVDAERARLRGLHHRGLVLQAQLLRRDGAPSALAAAEAVVDHDPLDETGHLLLGEAHLAARDRASALRAVRDVRVVLAEELGLDASPAVDDLERRALEPEPVASAGLPLPPPLAPSATPVVGRTSELDRVGSLLASGAGMVVLAGEPGVGKTTVAAAVARVHHAAGGAVLLGACHRELAPLAPWTEALRRPARWLDERGLVGGAWNELFDLVARGPGRGGLDEPDRDRTELHAAVADALGQLRGGRPPLVLLDDIHEADPATMLLAEHLAGEGHGVLLLATARFHEVDASVQRDALARMRRDDRLSVVDLPGLEVAALSDLVDTVTGAGTTDRYPRLAPALHDATAGNPLYVREALRHLVTSGNLGGVRDGSPLFGATPSPEGLEALIDANLARLGARTRQLLEVAALVGPVADVGVVIAVAGVPAAEAHGSIDRSVQAGVLTETGGGVRFVHPLVREVLVGSLTDARRTVLHRAIGQQLAGGTVGDATALARHLQRGGGAAGPGEIEPIAPAREAGDRALAAFAYEDAVTWYQHALELAEPAGARPTEVAALLVALGDALNRAGRAAEAIEPLTAAVALARARRDPALLATAVLEQARLLVDEGVEGGQVNARLVEQLEDALGADPPPPPGLRARLRARLTMELHFAGDLDRALAMCDVGEQEATAAGDAGALATVLAARHYSLYGSPRVQERLEVAARLAELQPSGRPDMRLLRNYLELGDVGALRAAVTEFTGRLPRGIASDRYVVEVWRAAEAALEGRLADAEGLAQRAVEVGYVSSRGRAAVEAVQGGQVFAVRFFQGRLGELTELLVALASAAPERPIWRAAAALCDLQAGERDGAAGHLERVRGDGWDRLPWNIDRPLTLAMAAWVAAEVGSDADAAALLDLLVPYEELLIVNGAAPSIVAGPAAYPLACLASRLGDRDRADRWFCDAEAVAERWASRPWQALTQLDHARHLRRAGCQRSGTGRDVEELRTAAVELARGVGMPHVESSAAGWT
jgi:DNA-binding SARP family transcriptional activator